MTLLLFTGCAKKNISTEDMLIHILNTKDLSQEAQFALINKIATEKLKQKQYDSLILFLTEHVNEAPEDTFNAYWLLMTAFAYMENDAMPIATYYMERIIQNYDDLIVKGKSVHLLCLENLIKINDDSKAKVFYFNQLINKFSLSVNVTELYMKEALEYEKLGEWDLALKAFKAFLNREDATTIVIPGISNAYAHAKSLIDFSNSKKDWTFATLQGLESAIKNAIATQDWKSLDRYKSKVNFFAMSWAQDGTDESTQEGFSMRVFMRNKISFSATHDPSSTPNEVYLRSWGWSVYMPVWYLYFRKINFPPDPNIHGRWEWAGIYFGEKL